MITRRELPIALGAGTLTSPFTSIAQLHDKKMPRVGYLSVATSERDIQTNITSPSYGLAFNPVDRSLVRGATVAAGERSPAGRTMRSRNSARRAT